MRLGRKVAEWWPIGPLAILVALAALDMFDLLGPVYRSVVQRLPPSDVWEALGTWFTAFIAVVTVVVAGRYAKQQVEKAQDQVREAREARLAQEEQAQKALATQVQLANEALIAQAEMNQRTLKHDAEQAQKVRQEQAQPNVVLYTELNQTVKQYIEIVVKNFGATPAYDVKVIIDPVLKSTPNNLSGSKLYEIPIPEFSILAPGQEWRTGWDHSPTRKNYQKKWRSSTGKTDDELTDQQNLEIQFLQTHTFKDSSIAEVIEAMTLPSRHIAKVTYCDSEGRPYETKAVLDSELFKGTTWVDIKSVHNLTKTLEKQLSEQNKVLDAIHRRLAEFGTEHEGVWTYTASDDEERQYRRFIAAAQRKESQESTDHFEWQIHGRKGDDPLRRLSLEDVTQQPIEKAKIGDWYVEDANGDPEPGRSWRIAFVKKHVFDDSDPVYELFRPDGESVREFEGTLIYTAKNHV